MDFEEAKLKASFITPVPGGKKIKKIYDLDYKKKNWKCRDVSTEHSLVNYEL